MSLRELFRVRTVLMALVAFAALQAFGQYSGRVSKDKKDKPELRAIAVLEWTGDEKSPKASRLVPVAVLDGGQLQDGSIYLARPEPMAVAPEVEYELQLDGKPVGLFDVHNAGQQFGSWVGFGAWKPLVKPKPKQDFAKLKLDDDVPSDEPVLHRKHHADDPKSSSGQTSGSDNPAPPADPDRPTLHKKTSDTSSDPSPAQDDPDRPTLHKKTDSDASAAPDDPDRPVLHKKTEAAAAATSDDEFAATDPNRPRLRRGKASSDSVDVLPSLVGLPPDLNQQVAVSDSQSRPEHVWSYAWSNPEDEAKMKASMEDIARTALGINPPPPAAKPKPKTTATTSTTTTAHKATKPAPPPVALTDEQFRVFELAYGSGATLVLTAHTDGPVKDQKFVTLIAQPDLYGNVLVLLKNVTDGSHLDEKPRMKLIDAVDAMADNRGELLFELRGATQRQFALYRVMRGTAEKLLVSGGADFADSGGD